MTVDGFFSSNPARQMRLAMSAELPSKTKPRMHANRRELLLQNEVYRGVDFVGARPYSRLFAACPPWRVHSWLVPG